MNNLDFPKERVAFALGTGRCGTKFLYKLFDIEPPVSSVHERNPLNETFHRYCKWYNINIDNEGFLKTKEKEIKSDLVNFSFSFESSAYLSLSVVEIYKRFNAKFILLVRNPHSVVNSYLYKGWYKQPIHRANPNVPPSYQTDLSFHHFLGRIIPSGDKYFHWQEMTRIGKLAWYWSALNNRVFEQFQNIPSSHWCVHKLEELNYNRYQDIAKFIGIKSTIKRDIYEQIVKSRPNSSSSKLSHLRSWSEKEISEFETEVEPLASKLGYESRVKYLIN